MMSAVRYYNAYQQLVFDKVYLYFLANVNSRSRSSERSLFAVARLSVCLSVCRL